MSFEVNQDAILLTGAAKVIGNHPVDELSHRESRGIGTDSISNLYSS